MFLSADSLYKLIIIDVGRYDSLFFRWCGAPFILLELLRLVFLIFMSLVGLAVSERSLIVGVLLLEDRVDFAFQLLFVYLGDSLEAGDAVGGVLVTVTIHISPIPD